MSYSRLCPVRASTSAFDTLSIHVTPMIFLVTGTDDDRDTKQQ